MNRTEVFINDLDWQSVSGRRRENRHVACIWAGLVVLLCIVAHQMLRHHVTAVVHATEYTMADHPVMEIEIQNSGRIPLFQVKAVLQIENRVFEETKKIGYTGLVAAI